MEGTLLSHALHRGSLRQSIQGDPTSCLRTLSRAVAALAEQVNRCSLLHAMWRLRTAHTAQRQDRLAPSAICQYWRQVTISWGQTGSSIAEWRQGSSTAANMDDSCREEWQVSYSHLDRRPLVCAGIETGNYEAPIAAILSPSRV